MRYITKTTLKARLESSENVVIFIPRGEVIETAAEQNELVVRVVWRGQTLNLEPATLKSTAEPYELARRA